MVKVFFENRVIHQHRKSSSPHSLPFPLVGLLPQILKYQVRFSGLIKYRFNKNCLSRQHTAQKNFCPLFRLPLDKFTYFPQRHERVRVRGSSAPLAQHVAAVQQQHGRRQLGLGPQYASAYCCRCWTPFVGRSRKHARFLCIYILKLFTANQLVNFNEYFNL